MVRRKKDRNAIKHSRARERYLERERKYHEEDIIQPWDEKGRRNPKFEKIYGDKIYAD